jgi:hypothetical protein
MKKIKFHSERPDLDLPRPIPASRVVPEWYRQMPGVDEGIETVKKCIPILDALTTGYVIPLSVDAVWDEKSKTFASQAHDKVNSDHNAIQTKFVQLGEGFDSQPHKWINHWHVKTPKGYSTLFIHPLNRDDLPFKSFTGIVDTDKHPLPVNFPFVLKSDFTGTIPAGTPIIQAIPFKRDDWESIILDTGDPYYYPHSSDNMDPPFNWYKRKFWNKKVYR